MAVSAIRAPLPPTALIGHEGEIACVRELVAGSRLVTRAGSFVCCLVELHTDSQSAFSVAV
jgi:hypothetical protein